MSDPSVLVLDSGIGGLSIVRQIREICRPLRIDYLADLEGFPYGTKSEQEITRRVVRLLEVSLSLYHPQVVVIACNTASTLVLDELRRRFIVPFVGVVPAIKPAARLTQSGTMAVLATEGTVNREYTRRLIQDFAPDKKVMLLGSARLVWFAEQKLKGIVPNKADLEKEFDALRDQALLDTVVLACTHFPLLKRELGQVLPQVKHWVDSGEAIARRVDYWLNQLSISPSFDRTSTNHFLFTGSTDFEYMPPLIEELLGEFSVKRIAV